MFRLWAKVVRNNHVIREKVIENAEADTRTHKVLHALQEACSEFDLAVPVWLDLTVRDFQRHSRCRFTKDAFIEDIDFDYLEIQMIEEDDFYS